MANHKAPKQVENISHTKASRKHIPTAEMEPLMNDVDKNPILVAYERRNPDLDPQLTLNELNQQFLDTPLAGQYWISEQQ